MLPEAEFEKELWKLLKSFWDRGNMEELNYKIHTGDSTEYRTDIYYLPANWGMEGEIRELLRAEGWSFYASGFNHETRIRDISYLKAR